MKFPSVVAVLAYISSLLVSADGRRGPPVKCTQRCGVNGCRIYCFDIVHKPSRWPHHPFLKPKPRMRQMSCRPGCFGINCNHCISPDPRFLRAWREPVPQTKKKCLPGCFGMYCEHCISPDVIDGRSIGMWGRGCKPGCFGVDCEYCTFPDSVRGRAGGGMLASYCPKHCRQPFTLYGRRGCHCPDNLHKFL